MEEVEGVEVRFKGSEGDQGRKGVTLERLGDLSCRNCEVVGLLVEVLVKLLVEL